MANDIFQIILLVLIVPLVLIAGLGWWMRLLAEWLFAGSTTEDPLLKDAWSTSVEGLPESLESSEEDLQE